MNSNQEKFWLTSKAVVRELKVSACELCHLRQAGALNFKKINNAYLYSRQDVEAVLKQKTHPGASGKLKIEGR
jgi:hypothetical protein